MIFNLYSNCHPGPVHAVGVASAAKLRGERRVAVSVFGDGASSKRRLCGTESRRNMASPGAVHVVNNQWAISVPRDAQAVPKLWRKAIAGGLGCRTGPMAMILSPCASALLLHWLMHEPVNPG